MSIFNDKALKSVADAVSKVLTQESSHGSEPKSDKEKKLASMAHPKDKITHKDVLVGRGVLKKEEAEQLDELSKDTLKSYKEKVHSDIDKKYNAGNMDKVSQRLKGNARAGMKIAGVKLNKEDVEQVEDEMLQEGFTDMEKYMKSKSAPQSSGGAGMKQGHRYGGGKQAPDVEDDEEEKKPARGKYGARQNFKRSVKEGFTGLINAYNHAGLKGLQENLYVEEEILEEEPDNEQFTKEVEDQKKSMEGKKKQPSVAAPATQGVKQMPEEVEIDEMYNSPSIYKNIKVGDKVRHQGSLTKVVYDHGDGNFNIQVIPTDERGEKNTKKVHYKNLKKEGVEIDEKQLDERTLTPDEKSEMEKNVKGMKKKLSGFKDRYGDRAISVMYATATRMAKEKK